MTIPNYLALYNLSQIEADIIVVSDLTATTGTIYTLFSTNGTITTLNSTTGTITTANIGTLFTNLWRGTSPTSTMIMGDTITSGNIRIGNYTTPAAQTGSIFLYGNTFITGNKSLFINNGDLSLVSSTGIITGGILRGVLVGDNISLYSTTTGTLTLGNTGGGNFTINPNVVLASGKNLTLSTTGKVVVDIIEGIATTDNILLFSTTSGTITFGNTTSGNLTLNPNVVLASGKTITLNSTGGQILCDTYTATSTGSNLNIGISGDTGVIRTRRDLYIGSTPLGSNKGIYCNYFDVLDPTNNIIFCATQTSGAISIQPGASGSLCNINIGNSTTPAGDISSLFIYKSTSFSANKILTMNTTGGEIKCDVYNGTLTSSNITLGKSGDTGNLLIYKTITTGNTYSGNNTFSGANIFSGATNTFNNKILCNTLTTTATSTNLVFGESGDTGLITPLRNIVMTTGSSGNKILCGFYDATSPGADLYIGNNQTSGSTILNNTYVATGKLINISSTGKLVNSTFESISPSTPVSLFNDITGADITISNTANTGKINMNANVLLGTGKTLTTSTTGSILCPTYNSTSATQSLAIGGTNTTADISLGGALTSGSINCGLIGMSGNINLLANTLIGTSATNKGLTCNYFDSFNNSDLVRISANLTTGNIRLGETQTTGGITLGHQTPASDSGSLTINKNTILASNKNLTLGYQSKLVGGTNGTANITAVAYTNIALFTSASVAGFYQVFVYGASSTQTYSVCCFLSADNSGAVQTIASRNMTFQLNAPNWSITATVVPTSTISMTYNVIRLV